MGLAEELVRLKVDAIVTLGTEAMMAVRDATKTIPTVMIGGTDPVGTGVIASLARPGGNITGLSINAAEISAKRVQLLKEAVPKLTRVAVLWNSSSRSMTDAEAWVRLAGIRVAWSRRNRMAKSA